MNPDINFRPIEGDARLLSQKVEAGLDGPEADSRRCVTCGEQCVLTTNSNTPVACIRPILHPARGQAVIVRIISWNIAFLCFMSPGTTRYVVTSGEASQPLKLLPLGNSKYFSGGARACVSLLGRMGIFCSWQDVETCAQINLNLSSPKISQKRMLISRVVHVENMTQWGSAEFLIGQHVRNGRYRQRSGTEVFPKDFEM
jgi:hypothetical protein